MILTDFSWFFDIIASVKHVRSDLYESQSDLAWVLYEWFEWLDPIRNENVAKFHLKRDIVKIGEIEGEIFGSLMVEGWW